MYIDYTTTLLEHCKNSPTASLRREQIQPSVRQYQTALNEWVDHRKNIISALDGYCDQLDEYSRNSRVIKTVGSSIGLVSGVIFIASSLNSSIWMNHASFVGTATAITSSLAFYVNWSNKKTKLNKLKKHVEKDLFLIKKVMMSQRKVEDMIEVYKDDNSRQILENEQVNGREMIEICESINKKNLGIFLFIFYGSQFTNDFRILINIISLLIYTKKLRTKSKLVERLEEFNSGLRNGLKALGT